MFIFLGKISEILIGIADKAEYYLLYNFLVSPIFVLIDFALCYFTANRNRKIRVIAQYAITMVLIVSFCIFVLFTEKNLKMFFFAKEQKQYVIITTIMFSALTGVSLSDEFFFETVQNWNHEEVNFTEGPSTPDTITITQNSSGDYEGTLHRGSSGNSVVITHPYRSRLIFTSIQPCVFGLLFGNMILERIGLFWVLLIFVCLISILFVLQMISFRCNGNINNE